MRPAWLAQAPWRTCTFPSPARSPERTLEVVAAGHLDDDDCPYRKLLDVPTGNVKTFCNKWVCDATTALACRIPDEGYVAGQLREWQVLEMKQWLLGVGVVSHGWELLASAHVAQAMADQGQVGVALWQGATADHGHIALVVPSLGEPGTWIAQAGASCHSRCRVEVGFGDLPVTYFGHA